MKTALSLSLKGNDDWPDSAVELSILTIKKHCYLRSLLRTDIFVSFLKQQAAHPFQDHSSLLNTGVQSFLPALHLNQ